MIIIKQGQSIHKTARKRERGSERHKKINRKKRREICINSFLKTA